jgi:hypothetical protein
LAIPARNQADAILREQNRGLCHHGIWRSQMRVFITAGRGHNDKRWHLRLRAKRFL